MCAGSCGETRRAGAWLVGPRWRSGAVVDCFGGWFRRPSNRQPGTYLRVARLRAPAQVRAHLRRSGGRMLMSYIHFRTRPDEVRRMGLQVYLRRTEPRHRGRRVAVDDEADAGVVDAYGTWWLSCLSLSQVYTSAAPRQVEWEPDGWWLDSAFDRCTRLVVDSYLQHPLDEAVAALTGPNWAPEYR